jgi:hypothetical protein
VCLCALGLARPASAQELTAVQQAFVYRQPLTMIPNAPAPEAALTFEFQFDLPQQSAGAAPQGAVPTPKSTLPTVPGTEFKKAKLSRVFLYGLQLTFYEHIMRVAAQNFTRQELEGPFFQDWFDSVHMPSKWGDLDSWQVNYLGHAIHGSAAARIWLDQREPKATSTSQYLKSMGRAFIFSIIFSEQYEIGPVSEASIGNVGLREGRTGWVDHIWTPCGAILWAIAEDGIDKYFLTFVDKHVPFLMARAAARMILNPGRMLANVGQNRVPWYRAGRPISAGLGR